MNLPPPIALVLRPALGLTCRKITIGEYASLSLGFGPEMHPGLDESTVPRHEWEMGSFLRGWRIVQGDQVICGPLDIAESGDELAKFITAAEIGNLNSVEQLGHFDVRLRFDSEIEVHFLCLMAEEDEVFHIFGPGRSYIQFHSSEGWRLGRSDRPWPNSSESSDPN